MSFGALPNNTVMSVASCANPQLNTPTNYQFNGTIQLWGNSVLGTHPINVLEVGYDTYNSFIDATGNVPGFPDANRLLINYYCGHDVFMCTGTNGGNIQLTGNNNASVGIGTGSFDPQYKLLVNGVIRAKKVIVEIGWSDYVFSKNYNLMSIDALDKYISANNHLPNVPPAQEIQEKGLDVGAV